MSAGDALRVWFPEMIDELRLAWSAEMTWDELAEFCSRITQVRKEIRQSRGIQAPLTRCPRCGVRSRSELEGVTIRSALYVLKNHDIVTEVEFKALDKRWKQQRAKMALDAHGKPNVDPATSETKATCCTVSSEQLPLDFQAAPTPPKGPSRPPAARLKTTTIEARGPVGRKLIQAMRRERSKKVVDFSAMAEGDRNARELQQGVASKEDLAEYAPSHGWYVLAQRQLSVFIEQTGNMRETLCFTDPINDADDEYMPIGPPMSPLTRSYFFYWSTCDLSPKGDGETLASATLDLVREVGTEPHLLTAMETLAASRMGLWEHRGHDGNRVILRELVTEVERRCHVASGYRGEPGELWFARVLPPGIEGLDAVVITMPYLLIRSSRADWLAYLDRALAAYPADKRKQVYPLLMKYGENPRYWPEYVFEAYVNHASDVVYLTGFPDIEASRPHSRLNA
jgi:hypothetical protein